MQFIRNKEESAYGHNKWTSRSIAFKTRKGAFQNRFISLDYPFSCCFQNAMCIAEFTVRVTAGSWGILTGCCYVLCNSVASRDTVSDSVYSGGLPCLLDWSGRVTCISWSTFDTNCRSDLAHWPYDSHVCEALLAPWRLQHEELELVPIHSANMVGHVTQYTVPIWWVMSLNTQWPHGGSCHSIHSDHMVGHVTQYTMTTWWVMSLSTRWPHGGSCHSIHGDHMVGHVTQYTVTTWWVMSLNTQ
jgi:hypothetical protein